MKTTFKYLAAALAIVTAASCSKESNAPQQNPEPRKVFMTFTGTNEATKGVLDGLTPTWEVGDSLKVFDNLTPATANKFFVTNVEGSTITFSGTVTEGSSSYKAIYPYYAGSNWNGTIEKPMSQPELDTLNLNVTGYQYVSADNVIDPNALVSVASSDGSTFAFKNVISLAKFTITESNIKEVKFYAAKGNFKVLASTGEVAATKYYADYAAVIVRPKGTTYFAPGSYYAAVAPREIAGMMLVCKAGSTLTWKHTDATFDFQRNGGYDLGTVDNGNTLLAKWSFRSPFATTVDYTYTQSFSSKSEYDKEVGYGVNKKYGTECCAESSFAGTGKIRFYQATSGSQGIRRDLSKNRLEAGYAKKDDYWEFSLKNNIPAGTKLHLYFKANNSQAKKVFKISTFDGENWTDGEEYTPGSSSSSTGLPIDIYFTVNTAITNADYTPLVRFTKVTDDNVGWPRIVDNPDGQVDRAPYIEIVTE